MSEKPYTPADVERLGQAMADANTSDAWIHPQIVPMAHFAKVVLDALAAAGRLLPAGASLSHRQWIFPMDSKIDAILPDGTHRYRSTHCRHDRHYDCRATVLIGGNPYGAGDAAIKRKPAQCKTCAAPCICPCHEASGW